MTPKKQTFYARDIFITATIALAIVFITAYILAAFQSQLGSVALYNLTNSNTCQFVAGHGILATPMYCRLNATKAICSNNGGVNIPFLMNYSYLAWPSCNATQMAVVGRPSSIQIIDN